MDLRERLDTEDIAWKLVAAGAGLVAAAAARSVAKSVWRQTRGGDPPLHPESPETDWSDALAWAAITGLSVALAELVAKRATARGWSRSRGGLPKSLAERA